MAAPYTRPTLLVDGTDYTDYLVPESLSLSQQVQQGVASQLAYNIKKPPGGFPATGGKYVEFYLRGESTPVFTGFQTGTMPRRQGPQVWVYQCKANGWEQVFYRRQLFTAFRGLSFAGAVNQLLNDPAQGYPTALSLTVSDPDQLLTGDMPFYAVNGAFPGDILNLIASLSNTSWRVVQDGADQVLEFFDPFNTYGGFTLTQNNRSFNWDTFMPRVDLEGVINTQSVRGAQAALETPQTAYFRGDGLSSKFDLPTKPFNNAASVVVFDSFNSAPISTSVWFESDRSGDYVYADDEGFIQYTAAAGQWVGLISTGLVARSGNPTSTFDINWVTDGIAMLGLTKSTGVGTDPIQFLEAGVYMDATGTVYGVSGGNSLGTTGLNLANGSQYRFRFTVKSTGGCVIEYQAGDDIYTRNWTLLFETSDGDGTTLGTAAMSYSAGMSLAMVKTVYPYLNVKLEVDRGDGFFQEEVGIYPIDEDVDAVIVEESTLAFFGSDPGPSTIPPAPSWQDDPDYKNIKVTYQQGVNIFATYRDSTNIAAVASLFGGVDTGIREGSVLVDETITSYAAALARGRVEVLNRGNIIGQINAETSVNILSIAGVPLPVCGELARFAVVLPTTSMDFTGDIPVRKIKLVGKTGLNDLRVEIEAGYVQRGLKSVLTELSRSGVLLAISEDQIIYAGETVSDTVTISESASSFGAGNTRRWGDSRLNRTFTANATTNLLTTPSSTLFVTGDDMQVSSSGTLPGGLSVKTVYYINKQSSTTYYLYDTRANAISGGATGRVDITSTGSGTHTLMPNGWQWGNHKWNSFMGNPVLRGEGTLNARATVFKRVQLTGEAVLNARAKVNGL